MLIQIRNSLKWKNVWLIIKTFPSQNFKNFVVHYPLFSSKMTCFFNYFIIIIFLMFIFEREREQAGERQRERETQNPKQAPGSELSAQSPMWGLTPRTVRL